MKNRKAAVLTAAGLVAGLTLGTIGVAVAATESTSTAGSPLGRGMSMMRGALGGGRMGGRMGGGVSLVRVVAKLTGLSETEVLDSRRSGKSLTDIAKAEGVTSAAVVDEALDQSTVLLDAQVKIGALTSAEKEQALTDLETRFGDEMTRTGQTGAGPGMRGMRGGRGGSLIGAVAELTGLSEADVVEQRQAGKSLTEIAKAKGVSADAVVSAALKEAATLLDARVEAGAITTDQRKQFLADLKTVFSDEMTHTGQTGMGRGFGRGGGFGGRRGACGATAPSASTSESPVVY